MVPGPGHGAGPERGRRHRAGPAVHHPGPQRAHRLGPDRHPHRPAGPVRGEGGPGRRHPLPDPRRRRGVRDPLRDHPRQGRRRRHPDRARHPPRPGHLGRGRRRRRPAGGRPRPGPVHHFPGRGRPHAPGPVLPEPGPGLGRPAPRPARHDGAADEPHLRRRGRQHRLHLARPGAGAQVGHGWVPKPGWTGEADWTGTIPFEELPQAFNPESGILVNANNQPHGADYPHFISDDFELPYRAERIAQMLAQGGDQSANTSARMQRDVLSLMAKELVPLMTGIEGADSRQRAALGLLRKWDLRMAADRPEPLIFNAWLRQVVHDLAADELGPLFARYWTLRPTFVRLALGERRQWCDDTATAATESCPDILKRSLATVLDDLQHRYGPDMGDWRWGDAHRARFDHALSPALLGRLPGKDNAQVASLAHHLLDNTLNIVTPVDGGNYTVNRAAMFLTRDHEPFASRHGAGLRAVYDFADLSKSRFMIATGQSGNPLSSHYRDMVRHWRIGRSFPLERHAQDTLKLLPK
ncbi:MAG: penicillin acylase family protein [Hyphomicrobiales bacterium]|nr:penicillin acylase family protein [Hyphomicrobiales bacterium]